MTKRKAKYDDAVYKVNKTPAESTHGTEFAAEYTGENMMKGANRNSKKGREGKEMRGTNQNKES